MLPDRINRRRNLGVEKGGTKEENKEERDMPRARSQACQPDKRSSESKKHRKKVKSSKAKC